MQLVLEQAVYASLFVPLRSKHFFRPGAVARSMVVEQSGVMW
jgi:hypothetical protein